MTRRPDIQDRVRQELRELEVNRPDPTCDDIDALPYLSNFVKEVLRHYPPGQCRTLTYGFTPCSLLLVTCEERGLTSSTAAVNLPRQAAVDLTIEGVRIPKGTAVDAVPGTICMNPLIWGDDAQEFRPDRWDHLTKAQASPYSYQAFSSGPRVCVGRQFALHEVKAMLFEMVRKYRFVSVEGDFTVENPAITHRPCGLKVRYERISNS